MKLTIIAAGAFCALAIACGGGDSDKVLHLEGGDVSESQYRSWLDGKFTASDCQSIRLESDESLAVVIMSYHKVGDTPKGWTPKPQQEIDETSAQRVAVMVRGACDD
jgi:hypothetical protein